ncbi:nuclear GTPase SLIP-GC-like [Perca flavescens]|uniref:nuclear GTPase SLIP-GC-like n=1 Tax=Perca flavescens TaxID=8167 RepID=UPI00106E1A0C|nr:nuclear GTPase SLIP-GC-like [Perca flavescens]
MFHFLGDKASQKDDDYPDFKEKLSALYGRKEKENITSEMLMEEEYFSEIPEFLENKNKILPCESAEELSTTLVRFTRVTRRDSEDKESLKRWYWPLVKCVTVRVPQNDLLQHVTLVDLPGNGDRNKSRDEMWKKLVGSCSTVWIVTDIERAAAEKEAWEILESASSLMGNGGECQHIHFICSKSDLNLKDHEAIRKKKHSSQENSERTIQRRKRRSR